MAFSNVARYSEPGRFFWATQNVAPARPEGRAPGHVDGSVAAVEVDHQDAAVLVGEVGEAFRLLGGRRERLLAEDVHVVPQAGVDGVRMLRTGSQHEDRIQVLGREHVLDRPVGGAEAPAPHQRSRVRAARHEGRELHVVPLDQCRQLRDGGDVPCADDADAGPGLRAHRALSAAAGWARAARSAAADRGEADRRLGQVLRVPAVLVLEGEDVVVAERGEGGEDAAPGHDAVADDARPHRALRRRDACGLGGLERRVRVGEHEVLDVHVPDQVALDAQRLLVGLVVGERQVGLVVEDPYRGVVDLTHQPCRLGR